MDRFPYSSAPVKRVKAIQFGILDPDFVVSGRRNAGKGLQSSKESRRRQTSGAGRLFFFSCRPTQKSLDSPPDDSNSILEEERPMAHARSDAARVAMSNKSGGLCVKAHCSEEACTRERRRRTTLLFAPSPALCALPSGSVSGPRQHFFLAVLMPAVSNAMLLVLSSGQKERQSDN